MEHYFTVPLIYGPANDRHDDSCRSSGETITVFAREYSSLHHSEEEAAQLPWLLFLQGGPGGRGDRVTTLSGWLKAAAKEFRILMLDQRGTGLSTPIDCHSLPLRGDAIAQAEYLTHFRADSIVADAEYIRRRLKSGPWSVLGYSYGGFCALSYLSFAPEGLREVLITAGLAPLRGSAERIYRATFPRLAARNSEYFARYPEDRMLVTRIVRHLEKRPEYLPSGERLTSERFQMVGSLLTFNTRINSLHYLFEDAFIDTPSGERLSQAFLEQVRAIVSRADRPLYAVLHESIYAQGQPTDWAAWRILEEFPEFRPDADEPLLAGEMIYPWYYEQDPALAPFKEVAHLLAAKPDWPPLYDVKQLGANTVPVAAAVYKDDISVEHDLSLETAATVQGLRLWVTDAFHHDGIEDDGEGIFGRLLGLARGHYLHSARTLATSV